MVAQGFSQVEGIDYHKTYALVTYYTTIQTLLVLTIKHQWYIHQMDAKTVFLNSNLSKEIYMKASSGSSTYDIIYSINSNRLAKSGTRRFALSLSFWVSLRVYLNIPSLSWVLVLTWRILEMQNRFFRWRLYKVIIERRLLFHNLNILKIFLNIIVWPTAIQSRPQWRADYLFLFSLNLKLTSQYTSSLLVYLCMPWFVSILTFPMQWRL